MNTSMQPAPPMSGVRMDTFVFRPTTQENARQAQLFAAEVVPAVKEAMNNGQ